MRKLLTVVMAMSLLSAMAQKEEAPKEEPWMKMYRATATKINDLVHTKVKVRFDYAKSYMYGKAWVTLKPHFYPTDSLSLDAKAMIINAVEMVSAGKNIPLKYEYDSLNLTIKLGKTFKKGESYTIYIDYTAKPNDVKTKGSAAINDAKGLYFINPKGEDSTKPTEIWTQGETESNSAWVPTIDKPNQKTTDEIYMTVPDKYVTLSNGLLVSQTKNMDGTRTDYWKMDLPHAPYLMFMGVGKFSIVKDSYKGKEVSYYVEKEYEKVARRIFGLTPEMIKFYSEKVTGIDYPWAKYSQMVGRDYVSGAMENTTSTLHGEGAQQNERELVDGNVWEDVISHELFHQWFGDLVTAESWSNITVNESMADYSEYLWKEYKYGGDIASEENYSKMQRYLGNPADASKDLVRFYYEDREDVFDLVSYPKGGRILNMLRHYVCDSAFFKSLNLYLNTNKFGNGSAHKLRMAFEQVTGMDLNWYFNQWYFGSGHPKVDISYAYDADNKKASVFIKQIQAEDKVFILPIDVDIYAGGKKTRTTVWMRNKTDTFTFDVTTKPTMINVDGDKFTLWEKQDHKTTAEFVYQYNNWKNFVDRREAIDYATKHKSESTAFDLLKKGLNDPYFKLRNRSILGLQDTALNANTLNKIESLANTDPSRYVRAYAITALSKTKDSKYMPFFVKSTKDSSYTVAGAALEAILSLDEDKAIALLPELKKDARGSLKDAITKVEIATKGDKDFDQMTKDFTGQATLQDQFGAIPTYIEFLGRVNNTDNFKKGLDEVVSFREKLAQYGASPRINGMINAMAKKKATAKAKGANAADIDAQLAYIKEKTKE